MPKKEQSNQDEKISHESLASNSPKLASRRDNRKAHYRLGRTIGAEREHIETSNERAAARKKDKKRKRLRVFYTILGFVSLVIILVVLLINFLGTSEGTGRSLQYHNTQKPPSPTIDIIDEDAAATGGTITTRMKEYIGLAEQDFRDLGYQPIKAVVPTGSIRQVNFYLKDYTGYIKMVIDRDPAISVEDASRMLNYLAEQGISSFEYIDVRIDKRAYWR